LPIAPDIAGRQVAKRHMRFDERVAGYNAEPIARAGGHQAKVFNVDDNQRARRTRGGRPSVVSICQCAVMRAARAQGT